MKKKIPVPKITKEINHKELRKILKRKLRRAHIFIVDTKKHLIDKSEMERFLREDKTDLIKYCPEIYDCDNFAWRLLGNINVEGWSGIAFGFAFSKVHAFNIFVGADKEVYIIEPQADKISTTKEVKKLKNKKVYLPVQIVMM